MILFERYRWMADAMLRESDARTTERGAPTTYSLSSDEEDEPNFMFPQVDGFAFTERLLHGRFASVYRGVRIGRHRRTDPPNEVAAKVFSEAVPEGSFALQLHFLRSVQGHPNIISLRAFQEREPRAIVVPLYEKNLHAHAMEGQGISEGEAARIMLGLLKGVQHVHSRKIIHRDIKPQHVAISPDPSVGAVLLKFEFACYEWDVFATQARLGTPGFVAPEVALSLGYNTLADTFAVGSVLYFIFAQTSPFHTVPFDLHTTLRLSVHCQFEFGERFASVTSACKALIRALLTQRPAYRLSAESALAHPWFLAHPSLAGRRASRPAGAAVLTHGEANAETASSAAAGIAPPALPAVR
eukprot:TRINITY_DN30829_c0_g1_i1.p1 TRINITY_DN30829_c0_g1~~TRINITY_DN30829_c0_g1_i1.p1  ORF type:complete len:356 (-),score=26.76 TRINITY_DN30829_c0_g1_i1:548-1615(-)